MTRPSCPRLTAVASIALMAIALASTSSAQVVEVAQGEVSGATSQGVESFLGIPYAATTEGENRWRAPRPAPGWDGVREATAFGPACQQEISGPFGPFTAEYLTQGAVSEDCLSVNVWRPAGASATDRLPVMVWIHGGGYASGSSSVPVYDGEAMARRGIVFVSVNYRLGVFGFLAHPDLAGQGSGNFGLLDLIASLEWVRDNIPAFGGDPEQVTLAGQSAGSMAIHNLMVAPGARGLFDRVISQSGPGIGYPPGSLAEAEARGTTLLAAAEVGSIEDLRALPAERVEAAAASLGAGLLQFAPVIDTGILPVNPYDSIPGTFADVPILAGMNADEAFSLPVTDPDGFNDELEQFFGDLSADARQFYDASEAASVADADRVMRRDRGIASTFFWATGHARASDQPAYLYLFEHVEPGTEEWGAFHTSEVPYALQTLDKSPDRTFGAVDRELSDLMAGYWERFVKTGNPNSDGKADWPAFDPEQPMMRMLGETPANKEMLDPEKRSFYGKVIEAGRALTLF